MLTQHRHIGEKECWWCSLSRALTSLCCMCSWGISRARGLYWLKNLSYNYFTPSCIYKECTTTERTSNVPVSWWSWFSSSSGWPQAEHANIIVFAVLRHVVLANNEVTWLCLFVVWYSISRMKYGVKMQKTSLHTHSLCRHTAMKTISLLSRPLHQTQDAENSEMLRNPSLFRLRAPVKITGVI